jgi:ribosomal protein S21
MMSIGRLFRTSTLVRTSAAIGARTFRIRTPGSGAVRRRPANRSIEEECRMQVLVRDNNVDQALKVLKTRMQREGIFREMKVRCHCEKPSEINSPGNG